MLLKWFYEENKDGGGDGNPGDDQAQKPPQDYDGWLNEQPDDVKTLLDSHTSGLKSALQSERDARRDLEKQVRDLAGKAEKGSEAQTELTKLADKIAEADRRADFFEAAHAAGVTNLKLAYTVALADEMFDKRGAVNFETMKQAYPELFSGAAKAPKGNAGDGRNNNQAPAAGMNAFIRSQAGRT